MTGEGEVTQRAGIHHAGADAASGKMFGQTWRQSSTFRM
jgi:hypothetical protein